MAMDCNGRVLEFIVCAFTIKYNLKQKSEITKINNEPKDKF